MCETEDRFVKPILNAQKRRNRLPHQNPTKGTSHTDSSATNVIYSAAGFGLLTRFAWEREPQRLFRSTSFLGKRHLSRSFAKNRTGPNCLDILRVATLRCGQKRPSPPPTPEQRASSSAHVQLRGLRPIHGVLRRDRGLQRGHGLSQVLCVVCDKPDSLCRAIRLRTNKNHERILIRMKTMGGEW